MHTTYDDIGITDNKEQAMNTSTLKKLDYTHMGGKGLERFTQLSNKCQRCGSTLKDGGVCETCDKEKPKRGESRQTTGWGSLVKNVTTEGLKVLVNGEVVATALSLTHLEQLRKFFIKKHMNHNAECLKHCGKNLYRK